ncbi:hypothetical protein [Paraburkholderia sp. J63]|uniref:hypothetical protein n=1 Tax=Paraburkholderia sp. J63 TaxID=2805434 RepID=UPI002ABE6ECC|nr:hypothetical protein [Paraburkholderia sp. J63]
MWLRSACAVALIVGSVLASGARAEAVIASLAPPGSQTVAQTATVTPHPRICLALSGGGARGYAHLGVLKELEACMCRSTASRERAWAP